MASHPRMQALAALGQSIWLDNMRRGMLSGELQALIADDAVTGITANPTIFEKAIAGSADYDDALKRFALDPSLNSEAVYERLAFDDIGRAADILRPIYERTGGRDGFVSIEVSPELANDTQGTIAEVRRFWGALERPNVMIKIPGTAAGVPAIRAALTEGINVNVTLLFSVKQYEAVALAHQDALEARLAKGLPIDRVASVASFFVSRVDTLVDRRIDDAIAQNRPGANALRSLRGTIGIANSKIAFARFTELTRAARWKALESKGAQPQRVLWASTSSKDPKARDVRYVEALAGPLTVDTIPPETLVAFADHGEAKARLSEGLDEARAQLGTLERGGISLDEACGELQTDGVRKFTQSIVSLRRSIDDKLQRLRG
ncbi:MAG: transaldolase [Deltaproteobacteria bacterium]